MILRVVATVDKGVGMVETVNSVISDNDHLNGIIMVIKK